MTRSYMKSRVLEALEQNDGNLAQAQRQVMQQALEDSKLMKELAEPHLKGIAAHAVDWVSREAEAGGAETAPPKEVSIEELGQMGEALAETIAGGGGDKFGTQGTGLAGKPSQTSEGHVDAIHQIANANKED